MVPSFYRLLKDSTWRVSPLEALLAHYPTVEERHVEVLNRLLARGARLDAENDAVARVLALRLDDDDRNTRPTRAAFKETIVKALESKTEATRARSLANVHRGQRDDCGGAQLDPTPSERAPQLRPPPSVVRLTLFDVDSLTFSETRTSG